MRLYFSKALASLLLGMLCSSVLSAQVRDSVFIPFTKLERQFLLSPQPQSLLPTPFTFDLEDSPSSTFSFDGASLFAPTLSKLYELQVENLHSQDAADPVATEMALTEAMNTIQQALRESPEIESDPRFKLAAGVLRYEYQMFYGIPDSINQAIGDIFAIQEELFSAQDGNSISLDIPGSVQTQAFQVPLVQNKYVDNHLKYLAIKRPEIMEKWLQRSKTYFPMMIKIFEEEGVPTELVHLAMIESGLVPVARSRAAAVGMWQFIQATGSAYGLEVNYWVDERRDPEKATRAAARHLRDLYNIWNDWHLALANYNVSPRRMRSAIRSSGGVKDYWVIYPYLPRETRGYVPSFIATTMIATNPQAFGFRSDYQGTPYTYEVADVDGSVRLDVLAKAAGVEVQDLRDLNPELLRWATPPSEKPYPLKLPVGTKGVFVSNYEKIPESEKRPMAVHIVKRGESLGKIAYKYGTSVNGLYQANAGLSNIIHPGQKLVIPLPGGSGATYTAGRPSRDSGSARNSNRSQSSNSARPPGTSRLTYTVKSNDTIGHIAEWYDTYAWRIRAWNNTSNNIRVGQKLVVYVPKEKDALYKNVNTMSFAEKEGRERQQRTLGSRALAVSNDNGVTRYTVRRNDNLHDIAKSFKTTVEDIRKINQLRGSTIYPGQKLVIPTTR